MNLHTIAEWLRNRRAPRGEVVTGWLLRAESEAMLDRAHAIQADAERMFAQADAAPRHSARQFRLTYEAYALDCDAQALRWRAGGDDTEAAECSTAAAEWRAKAKQFVEYVHAPAL